MDGSSLKERKMNNFEENIVDKMGNENERDNGESEWER